VDCKGRKTQKRLRLGAATIGAAVALLTATSAWGFDFEHGADYGYTFAGTSQQERIKICDNEYDGNSVYTDYYRTVDANYRRLEDYSGADPYCADSGASNYLIWKARACENITAFPDACGAWRTD
jgi:hypothetical protein